MPLTALEPDPRVDQVRSAAPPAAKLDHGHAQGTHVDGGDEACPGRLDRVGAPA